MGNNFSKKLSYIFLIAHAAIVHKNLPAGHIQVEHFAFVYAVYFLTDMVPRYAPKSLTFSEAFTLSTVTVTYANFSLKQLLYPVASSVGNPTLNAAMFLPWALLLLGISVWWLLGRVLSSSIAFVAASVTVLCCTGALISTMPDLLERIVKVVMYPSSLGMI